MRRIILFSVFSILTIQVMAQEKIVQTAGRDQLGEFAPKFAEETSADDAKARFQQEMIFPIG